MATPRRVRTLRRHTLGGRVKHIECDCAALVKIIVYCASVTRRLEENESMAKLVFGMNQSLDGSTIWRLGQA